MQTRTKMSVTDVSSSGKLSERKVKMFVQRFHIECFSLELFHLCPQLLRISSSCEQVLQFRFVFPFTIKSINNAFNKWRKAQSAHGHLEYYSQYDFITFAVWKHEWTTTIYWTSSSSSQMSVHEQANLSCLNSIWFHWNLQLNFPRRSECLCLWMYVCVLLHHTEQWWW